MTPHFCTVMTPFYRICAPGHEESSVFCQQLLLNCVNCNSDKGSLCHTHILPAARARSAHEVVALSIPATRAASSGTDVAATSAVLATPELGTIPIVTCARASGPPSTLGGLRDSIVQTLSPAALASRCHTRVAAAPVSRSAWESCSGSCVAAGAAWACADISTAGVPSSTQEFLALAVPATD